MAAGDHSAGEPRTAASGVEVLTGPRERFGASWVEAWPARWGGLLLRPRVTLRAMDQAEGAPGYVDAAHAAASRAFGRDVGWASAAVLAMIGVPDVAVGLKDLLATQSVGGALMLLRAVVFAVLPVSLTLVAAEVALGHARARRRGQALVIMVAAVAGLRLAQLAGVPVTGDATLAVLAGGITAAWAWAVRGAIAARASASATAGPAPALEPRDVHEQGGSLAPRDQAVARPQGVRAVAAFVLAAVIGLFALDLQQVAHRWAAMGPRAVGSELPQFALRTADGASVRSDELRGKVVVLTFWATWCGVCRQELPMIDALHRELAAAGAQADGELVVAAVNREGGGASTDEAAALARSYRDAQGLALPIWIDGGALGRTFGVRMLPHTVVVDRAGRMRHVHPGLVRGAVLRAEVEPLLAEPAP